MLTPESVTNAILVLGFKLSDEGKVQEPYKKRLDMAVKLHRKLAWPIITCGWCANGREVDLGKFCEADAGRGYIYATHDPKQEIPILLEPDSTSIQENLLFARERFPRLKKIIVVTSLQALERTQWHAKMVYEGNATVEVVGCEDGIRTTNPEREAKMLGDVKCMLKKEFEKEKKYTPGEWKRLLLRPENGRLRSKWNQMRDNHHETCPHYKHLHPDDM